MFTMTSCEDWFYIDHIGKPVEFGITTGKSIKTRTVYSGNITNGKERLEWIDGDDVRIWMYWDEDRDGLYESGYEWADYKVINNRPSNEKSYGRLSPKSGTSLRWHGDFTGENGRAHEYPHTFYSIYPADGGKDFDGANITFNIPVAQNGVNMGLAYMTAYRSGVYSNTDSERHVELLYYPRVTTLYIAVVNDTDETVGGEIKLTSSGNPIAGNYTVSIPNYLYGESENEGGTEITNRIKTLNKGDSDTVAFFIRPRQYASDELSLTFNGKTQLLNKNFEPNYKYNIKITVSGKVPPMIDDALAQLIFALLLKGDHNTCWSTFGEYLQNYFHYNNCDPDFLDGLYRDLEKMKNAPLDGTAAKLNELFPGDKLSGLLEVLGSLTEIDNVGNGPKLTAKSLDLSIFKSAQKIHLKLEQNTGSTMAISVSELNNLTTIDITDGTSQKIDLTVTDCKLLSKITIGQNEELQNLKLIRTPMFKEANINNQNRDVVSIELNNCSAETDNATINIAGNKNNDPKISRSGNTGNVTIYWNNKQNKL